MTKADRDRPCGAGNPPKRLHRTPFQDLPPSTDAGCEGAEESNCGHSTLPRHRTTTHHGPPAIRVIRIAVLEPRQSLLKPGVPAPTQLAQSVQHPSRQPWHRAPAYAAGETAVARSCFEQYLRRRLESGIHRIGTPLNRRQQAPARSRIRFPKRHIDGPRPVRKKISDQRGQRLSGIRTAAGTDHGRALRWSPDELQQDPPVEVWPVRVEKPGKRIASQRLPGITAGHHGLARDQIRPARRNWMVCRRTRMAPSIREILRLRA